MGDGVVANIAGALFGVDGLDLIVDADARNRRLHRDQHLARIVTRYKAQGFEVDHQSVGFDQERLVFVIAVIVEHRQLRLFEEIAIQYQVAGDLLHAVGPQIAHQQPELLHVELGVAAALEVQVALQNTVVQGAVGVELGFPLVGRAEHFQSCIGGHQFHGRRRVHRHISVEDGRNTRAGEWQQHQGQRVVLQLVGLERLLDFRSQGGVDRGGIGAEGERQKQAGQKQWS